MAATETETSILPDPADVLGALDAASVTPDRADDLIASLADRQIDDLMSDAGEPPREAVVEAAINSTVAAAEDVQVAGSALVTTAAGELKAELDQMEADRASAIIEHGTEAALPAVVAPSFDPSKASAIAEAPLPTPEVEAAAVTAHTPSSPTPPAEESGAEAVARELAEDVALLSKPLPSVIEHDAQVAADPKWRRALAFILSLPMLLLGAINLPVMPLSDRGREIIGAIGIVTLVNAAGLLIYLMAFARGH